MAPMLSEIVTVSQQLTSHQHHIWVKHLSRGFVLLGDVAPHNHSSTTSLLHHQRYSITGLLRESVC
jgi:hypothetical protein